MKLNQWSLFLVLGSLFINHPYIYGAPSGVLREIDRNDNPDILSTKTPLERSFYALNSRTPRQVVLPLRPWANGSWKLDAGLIASRYSDGAYMKKRSWAERRKYIQEISVERILGSPDFKYYGVWLDSLSAAEKYDLLVGDPHFTLTESLWAESEKHLKSGTLAHWMGICEGSAAASAIETEPRRAVDLRTARGEVIRFHVMDIKGLTALLWSAYNTRIPIAGSRCSFEASKKDSRGVVIDQNCFNNNPGSFHIAAINFIALKQKPFFINRVKSLEVWNVPVIGYEVQYFNVRTGLVTSNIDAAQTSLSDYPRDKFKSYRSKDTAKIIGVKAKITISNGTTALRDQTELAKINELSYQYDLELDSAGTIIGGEWHQDNHPDFMWSVEDDLKPYSIGDHLIGVNSAWDGNPIPSGWLSAVQQSSARNQPLEIVVRKLLEWSR